MMTGQPTVPPLTNADIVLVFDGGSRGNPGEGYGSFVIGGIVKTPEPMRLEFPGRATNNEAEYLTLLHGLRTVLHEIEQGGAEASELSIEVVSDSKLVVEQITGRWKVRHERLRPLHQQAKQLLSRFGSWQFQRHSRLESVRLLGH